MAGIGDYWGWSRSNCLRNRRRCSRPDRHLPAPQESPPAFTPTEVDVVSVLVVLPLTVVVVVVLLSETLAVPTCGAGIMSRCGVAAGEVDCGAPSISHPARAMTAQAAIRKCLVMMLVQHCYVY